MITFRLENPAMFQVNVLITTPRARDVCVATFNTERVEGAAALAAFCGGAVARGDKVLDFAGETLQGQPDA
jgi:hypothetical protein